jgi:hypothetical protein
VIAELIEKRQDNAVKAPTPSACFSALPAADTLAFKLAAWY